MIGNCITLARLHARRNHFKSALYHGHKGRGIAKFIWLQGLTCYGDAVSGPKTERFTFINRGWAPNWYRILDDFLVVADVLIEGQQE